MDNQKPRVGIFMAAGIVAAIVIGFFVWNASSSERSAQAGYVSETTSEQPRKESPVSKTSRVTSDKRSEQADDDAGQDPNAAPQQPQVNLAQPSTEGQGEAYSLNSDPYAPQHAVVGTAQQQASTRVFRPTNVVPTTVLPTTAAAMQGEGEAAEAPSPAESSAPSTQETPGTPGTSSEGSSTTTEPTPAEPKPADPAGEPAPEPPAGAIPTPSGAPQSAEQNTAPQRGQAHTQVGPEADQGTPPAPAPREAGAPQQGFSSEAQQAWNRWMSNFRR
ncbi:hypothetical protein [Corynebacterium sp. HMSC071B10]|uniref:hypothetical protein n=1 Tax=Corynebacterium sp. HMSC071B10 TaxID=1739494 RepID=UPI0008A11AC4|nr:hypothetical protein [Corynebacterium sp. HMSC071B10]OFP34161.1 hypothetical protein HMPREF2990_10585 [Corynebacterium sp. HMSC071B10]